ncbi:MAG: hypothetical protein HYT87_01150 [Nitrospirae bacterium]|nr:hypothetical protein [Nitrospirota bacterium]
MRTFTNHEGWAIRLPEEREQHILEHPEMGDQFDKIEISLREPDVVRESENDPSVHLYFHKFDRTPVTRKSLLVAVKVSEDPFVITAFFTNKQEGGKIVFER